MTNRICDWGRRVAAGFTRALLVGLGCGGGSSLAPSPERMRDATTDPTRTCVPDRGTGPEGPLSGRFIELQLLPRVGACGDGEIQLGEQCDDGNERDDDGCRALCRWEDEPVFVWSG